MFKPLKKKKTPDYIDLKTYDYSSFSRDMTEAAKRDSTLKMDGVYNPARIEVNIISLSNMDVLKK